MITYCIDTLDEVQIYNYLLENDLSFDPPFSSNVNIVSYSKKLSTNAVTYEAWADGNIIGLIAVYFNYDNRSAYIPYICVTRKGIGQSLFNFFRSTIGDYDYVLLEVKKHNISAIAFYKKLGFYKILENEGKFTLRLDL